jgi:hypothetical protein
MPFDGEDARIVGDVKGQQREEITGTYYGFPIDVGMAKIVSADEVRVVPLWPRSALEGGVVQCS